MSVTVREVRPDEWRDLRSLRLSALATDEDAFGDTLASATARTDQAWKTYAYDGPDSMTFVAVDTERFVGMARGRAHGADAGLYGMWVAPEHRQCGVERHPDAAPRRIEKFADSRTSVP